MEYEKLLRDYLDMAIRYNVLDRYLMGMSTFYVSSEPGDYKAPHAFYLGMNVYNKVNAEQPELKLSDRYVEELSKLLKSDKIGIVEVYSIFKCMLAQLKLENEKKATFEVSKENILMLLNSLRKRVSQFEDKLKNSEYAEGRFYENGTYEYMMKASENYYKETGKRIF